LVALLLDAREPISWPELREHFPEDYGAVSDDAAARKFERDKAELLELGIPLTYVQGDDEQGDGYAVDREAYYLPRVDLTPEELAVLYAAGAAALDSNAFPGREELVHALRKVGFSAGQTAAPPPVRVELGQVASGPGLAGHLEQLWAAARARKSVTLRYLSPRRNERTERRVDPYGLALRRGVWTLVGHCHLRGGLRSFHVHRVQALEVNTARPRSPDFEVPAGFRLEEHVAQHPWEHRFHAPVTVRLRVRGEQAALASRLFPRARLGALTPAGQELMLDATSLDGLLRVALSLGQDCEVLGPGEAVARHREMLEAVLARHAETVKEGAA
ncbi:MAG: WYL domain-containing protein, partial [Myxococcaceae bacterium]|nr:WYL domain-containing protein [Myxococcaceae bacterium]